MELRVVEFEAVDWIRLAQCEVQWQALLGLVINLRII
jgi:hypothetical protein